MPSKISDKLKNPAQMTCLKDQTSITMKYDRKKYNDHLGQLYSYDGIIKQILKLALIFERHYLPLTLPMT